MASTESRKRTSAANGKASSRPAGTRRKAASPEKEATSGQPAAEPTAGDEAPSAAKEGPSEPGSSWSFRDFLVPYILLAISVRRAHGYFIEQYLRNLGLANVEMSTLYRTLRQLEKDGLVCSTWEPGPEGPARRIYSLTNAGRWWLDAGAAALDGYRTLIDRFFGSYPGRTSSSD